MTPNIIKVFLASNMPLDFVASQLATHEKHSFVLVTAGALCRLRRFVPLGMSTR